MADTLYDDVIEQGIPHASHYSDLYIPVTPVTQALVKKHNLSRSPFINQVEGGWWYDVAFAYKPFWDKCAERSARISKT